MSNTRDEIRHFIAALLGSRQTQADDRRFVKEHGGSTFEVMVRERRATEADRKILDRLRKNP
jgi:hypothetical protein